MCGLCHAFSLQEGLDRMLNELEKSDHKRKEFHRRRAVNEAQGDHINDANRRFNARIERQLGKYSIDIKQSLERGTAL